METVVAVVAWVGDVGNLEGSIGPCKVVQAVREQGVMSLPDARFPWNSTMPRVFLSGLHLQVQEIAEQDWLLAILASTAEPDDSAKMIALGTTLLAEVAHVARWAFVDGVRDECGSLAERFPKEFFFQIRQGGVAQTEGTLAAGIGAEATAAAAAWIRAQQTPFGGGGRSGTIVTRIVTDGVCGD